MSDLIEREALLCKMEQRYKVSCGQAHKAYGIAIDDICDAAEVNFKNTEMSGYYSIDEILEEARGTDAYFTIKGILTKLEQKHNAEMEN